MSGRYTIALATADNVTRHPAPIEAAGWGGRYAIANGRVPKVPAKDELVPSCSSLDPRSQRLRMQVTIDRGMLDLHPAMIRKTIMEMFTYELDRWLAHNPAYITDPINFNDVHLDPGYHGEICCQLDLRCWSRNAVAMTVPYMDGLLRTHGIR